MKKKPTVRNENHTIKHKFELLKDLYIYVATQVDSFEEEDMGADLAYLMGAIIKGGFCAWNSERPFVKLLKNFWRNEEIFRHIEIERE